MRFKMKISSVLGFVLFISVMFSSCTEGPLGIFYSLEFEKKITDSKLSNYITVSNSFKTSDYYYIVSNTIRKKSVGDVEWVDVAPPESMSVCQAAVLFKGELYAAFSDLAGAQFGLYKSIPVAEAWQAITPQVTDDSPSISGNQVISLHVVSDGTNEHLYLTMRLYSLDLGNYYYLAYHSTDGISFTKVTTTGVSLYAPVNGGAYTNYNGIPTYWLISGYFLLKSTDGVTFSRDTDSQTTSVKGYGGIYRSALQNRLYLSSLDGFIAAYDGTSWTKSETVSDIGFTVFMDYETDTASITLVGAKTKGYYEITGIALSSPTALTTDINNYRSSNLYYSEVSSFLVDTVGSSKTIFAGTIGRGLWKNVYDESASARIWSIE